MTSSGNCTHERMLLSQKEIPAREETEELNSKGTLQVLPDDTIAMETTQKVHSSAAKILESPKKENIGKKYWMLCTPVFRKESDDSDQELKRFKNPQ